MVSFLCSQFLCKDSICAKRRLVNKRTPISCKSRQRLFCMPVIVRRILKLILHGFYTSGFALRTFNATVLAAFTFVG